MLKSVLLVDDSEIDIFVHRKIIELAGVAEQTISMNSPLKALRYLRGTTGGDDRPEIIFLDIDMPCMNGFEFLDALEADAEGDGSPYVVMLSSSQDDRDLSRARNHWSVLRFLHKPLTVEALHSLLLHAQSGRATIALAA